MRGQAAREGVWGRWCWVICWQRRVTRGCGRARRGLSRTAPAARLAWAPGRGKWQWLGPCRGSGWGAPKGSNVSRWLCSFSIVLLLRVSITTSSQDPAGMVSDKLETPVPWQWGGPANRTLIRAVPQGSASTGSASQPLCPRSATSAQHGQFSRDRLFILFFLLPGCPQPRPAAPSSPFVPGHLCSPTPGERVAARPRGRAAVRRCTAWHCSYLTTD